MRNRTPLAFAALLLGLFSATATAGTFAKAGVPADTIDVAGRVDDYLDRLADLGFAGAVFVSRDGETLLAKGYGAAEREVERPWTPATPSTIGSITKPFTAVAILTLVEDGRVSLDDPLPRFFDGVPNDKAEITVRHLLTHAAGFPGAIGRDDEPIERDDFVRLALATPLRSPPGERYAYSNVGYSLLGAIVEIVTDESYEAYLRKAVLEPAGMESTGYFLPGSLAALAAIGYRGGVRWGTVLERPWAADGPGWHLRANGGLHSTVGDLVSFSHALDEERILSPAWRDSMQAARIPEDPEGRSHYGFGWAIFESPRGTKVVAHNGGNSVFAADLARFVEEGLVVAALSNVAEWPAAALGPRLEEVVFGADLEWPPVVADPGPEAVDALVGRYRLAGGGTVEVRPAVRGIRILAMDGEALAALGDGASPGGTSDERRADRGARALAAMRAADRGDYAPLVELLGDGISVEEVRAEESRLRREIEERLGPRTDTRLLGTAVLDDRPTTVIEVAHREGSRWVLYRWGGSAVVGIQVEASPPSVDLRPSSATDFFAFDLRAGITVRAAFEGVGDGRADELAIERGDGETIRAERIPG